MKISSQSLSEKWSLLVVTMFFLWISPAAMADTTGSIETAFTNASTTWTALMNLAWGVSFVMGIFIAGMGLIKLKDVGSNGKTLKGPIMYLVIGSAMVSLPVTIDTITQTLDLGSSTGTQLLSTGSSSSVAGVGDALNGILLFVKLLGHIAFIRGLLIFKAVGNNEQGASFGRGLTHLLGGAAAININMTATILANTFFTGVTLPGGIGIG